MKVIDIVRGLAPSVITYFTKNGGLNTVTGAAAAGYLPLIIELLNSPTANQGIEMLSTGNKMSAIVASVVIALRVGLETFRSLRA